MIPRLAGADKDKDQDDGTDYAAQHPDHRVHATNACAVSDDNITRAETEILAQKALGTTALGTTGGPARAGKPWDHKGALAQLDLVEKRFALDRGEVNKLRRDGVVVPARLELDSYAQGYHEIFQSQLPVYITADSIFQTIFASHDSILEALESGWRGHNLANTLSSALDAMHCGLVAAAADYPADVARDLDLYLTVARALECGCEVHGKLDGAVDREATALLAQINAGDGIHEVTLFGRPRLIDFTQYLPRGHYANTAETGSAAR